MADGTTEAALAPPTVATLGRKVRRLRREKEMTMEQLATRASVSVGLLSQLERGIGNPSFNTLVQIAHALAVPITDLFPTTETGSPVVRVGERIPLSVHGLPPAGSNYLLTTGDGTLEAVLVEIPPGHTTEDTPFVHEGEEFGFILEGTQEVHLDGVMYTLEAGDAIRYPSNVPHWYRNPGDGVSRAIWVITPPTW